MKRRRILRYLTGVTVALALAAIFAAVAGAWDSGDKAPGTGQQTLTWTGNGWPAQQRCTPADPGNVGYQNGSSASDYMLWILNTDGGSITGGWSLTVGGTTYNTTDDHQLVTPFVDPTGAVANVDVASTGGGSWVLTLSHGCSGKTTPDISTVASSTGEGQVGDTLNDTATLAGGNNPTGKITFTAYGPDDEFCSTSVYSEDVTVNGNGDYSTATGYVVPAKGDYQWIASYGGDAKNEAVSTQCGDPDETLTFEAAAPDVETAIHLDPETIPPTVVGGATHVDLGSTVHDSATVSAPAVLGTPTGSVDFSFYSGTCEDSENATLVETDTVDLVNGVADPSKSHGPLGAGSYFYLATYHSDNTDVWQNSDSLCEPLTVDKAQLTIVTQIHDAGHNDVGGATHVPLGSVVHDTATVTGQVAGFDPTGEITFTLNGSLVDQITPPETGFAATTEDSAPLGAGDYTYRASVAGDSNYIGDRSGPEPLTVDKAQLTIVTQIHDAGHNPVGGATHVPLGSVVHDTATVTGQVAGFDPTGAITFTLNGSLVDQITPPETGFAATTEDSAPLGAGDYIYRASVAGDSNYIGDRSGPEPLTVDKAQLAIVTQIHDAMHNPVGGSVGVPNGSVVHDTATVTGQVPGFSIGTISFTLNGDPVGQIYPPEAGYTATTVDSAPLVSGSYVYAASVADNDNYIGGVSGDEPLTVRTYGKTMGFWGNTNGQALLPSNPGVTLGIVPPSATNTSTCWVVVNTKAKSLTILPNTLNGMSILTNCTATNKLDSGINANSMNTLLAQTLALEFNILYKGSYAGQTIGGMGLTGFIPTAFPTGKSLTATNTVEDVFAYANYLIGQAKSGGVPPNTVTITQSMIGQLNTLLGKLNAES